MHWQSWVMALRKHKTIPIFVPHWGCPKDCLFCDQKSITGQKEAMTPEKAADIIRIGIEHKKPDEILEIGFFGGSFTGIPATEQEALLSLAFEAKKAGYVDGIRLSTRPDYINETVLERLRNYGVTCVELGAQSMDDRVLSLNRRGHSCEQTKLAAKMIQKSGISLGLQMMVGLYGDTDEGVMKTAEAFAELSPDCVRIYPTLVIRGTGLCDLYESGMYTPLTVQQATNRCAVIYQFFTERKITVIRMGLLQTEPETVVAGPMHPAFGELVLSRIFYHKLMPKLENLKGKEVEILVHPKDVSALLGQNRENIEAIKKESGASLLLVLQDETIKRGDCKVKIQTKLRGEA